MIYQGVDMIEEREANFSDSDLLILSLKSLSMVMSSVLATRISFLEISNLFSASMAFAVAFCSPILRLSKSVFEIRSF